MVGSAASTGNRSPPGFRASASDGDGCGNWKVLGISPCPARRPPGCRRARPPGWWDRCRRPIVLDDQRRVVVHRPPGVGGDDRRVADGRAHARRSVAHEVCGPLSGGSRSGRPQVEEQSRARPAPGRAPLRRRAMTGSAASVNSAHQGRRSGGRSAPLFTARASSCLRSDARRRRTPGWLRDRRRPPRCARESRSRPSPRWAHPQAPPEARSRRNRRRRARGRRGSSASHQLERERAIDGAVRVTGSAAGSEEDPPHSRDWTKRTMRARRSPSRPSTCRATTCPLLARTTSLESGAALRPASISAPATSTPGRVRAETVIGHDEHVARRHQAEVVERRQDAPDLAVVIPEGLARRRRPHADVVLSVVRVGGRMLQPGRQVAVREHPDAGDHVRDHRPLGRRPPVSRPLRPLVTAGRP